jgi:hypothetical protein
VRFWENPLCQYWVNSYEKNRILNTIAVELTGKDTNGNPQTQNGTDAGC